VAAVAPLRVLISGGSRGLGLALCRDQVARGNLVATFARHSTAELEGLVAAANDRLVFFDLDLAADGAPRRAVAETLARVGAIDVLVNNVAIGQDALLAHTPDDEIGRIVSLNVTATLQLTRHAVRAMILSGGGTILNVSSICATRGYPGLTVYAASKGALEAFTRSAARELGGHGIVVNCLAAGFFESEMSKPLPVATLERIRRRTPTGTLTEIAQIVRACDPLLRAHVLNINGQVLTVDGGLTS
jgi:3-oxoacyl-[acyl-carrier protein] reductase